MLVAHPSLDTYLQLQGEHDSTLTCPCSQLAMPYGTFLNITYALHQICSSDLVSPEWLDYLALFNPTLVPPWIRDRFRARFSYDRCVVLSVSGYLLFVKQNQSRRCPACLYRQSIYQRSRTLTISFSTANPGRNCRVYHRHRERVRSYIRLDRCSFSQQFFSEWHECQLLTQQSVLTIK